MKKIYDMVVARVGSIEIYGHYVEGHYIRDGGCEVLAVDASVKNFDNGTVEIVDEIRIVAAGENVMRFRTEMDI